MTGAKIGEIQLIELGFDQLHVCVFVFVYVREKKRGFFLFK